MSSTPACSITGSHYTPRLSLWPAFGFGLSMALANGLGRFAYALLLPGMSADLHWSYAQAGWLNSANALGYVLGAASGYLLLRRFSARLLFVVGLWLCFLTLAVTGLSANIGWLSTQRILNGIGAAWVSACGIALVLFYYRHAARQRGAATGLFFGGAGIGIVLSGFLVNPLLAIIGNSAWPTAWLALGVAGAIAAIWPLRLAQCTDEAAVTKTVTVTENMTEPLPLAHLGVCLVAYFFFATSYIIYMTFIFAWIRGQGLSWQFGTAAWTLLGVAILVSAFLWQRPLSRLPGAQILSISCGVTLLGTLIPLIGGHISVLTSSVVFGVSVFIAPAAIAVLLRQNLAASRFAQAMALFNLSFAIGQTIGPYAAGALSDHYGLNSSLWLGTALLGVAAILPWLVRTPAAARRAIKADRRLREGNV
ncbi:YbfB/YjiJ family MFS transporter [Marinobacter sp. SS8-8]|uniref:YbfB/YjiJ family MFS transporter n=1 Tax=Marinobacter sp. SS8-8 TaxID=3050452 RepID=UPI0026DF34C5|nr:YbfB/YjiJ family MFS transporter [Marinobacter sp. SS8-8]|tara:strand:- start:75872 stop:77137 length:1266 start_codon:yes stop_codon:yes gene_type:complete